MVGEVVYELWEQFLLAWPNEDERAHHEPSASRVQHFIELWLDLTFAGFIEQSEMYAPIPSYIFLFKILRCLFHHWRSKYDIEMCHSNKRAYPLYCRGGGGCGMAKVRIKGHTIGKVSVNASIRITRYVINPTCEKFSSFRYFYYEKTVKMHSAFLYSF